MMDLREILKSKVPKNSVFDPPYTTIGIGGISGGIARNVIADKCRVDWEMRPVIKEDGEFVNNELNEFVNKKLLPEMKKIFPKIGSSVHADTLSLILLSKFIFSTAGLEEALLLLCLLVLVLVSCKDIEELLLGFKPSTKTSTKHSLIKLFN